jgi:hypothetical protein
MRTLLRYYKKEYLEIEEVISRMRGITMVLAHIGASKEMRLGHRVNNFLLIEKWKRRKNRL